MKKKQKVKAGIIFGAILAALLVGVILIEPLPHEETIQEVMRDAVLHETNKVSLFGLMEVNPGFISACCVTLIFLVFSLAVRIFVIPKFTLIPGKFQMILETAVGFFDNMAHEHSSAHHKFLSPYIFVAGAYIFIGTLFELFGIQVIGTAGQAISLPAPLTDINGDIALGGLSFIVILTAGLVTNGLRGLGSGLKEFSLPISMSFRLFGALLSGALVTELVYHYTITSFVVPILVAVLFTILHAVIQTYVLTTLTSVFYGEVSEEHEKKIKENKTLLEEIES